jgi:hypothetical protein
LFSESFHSLSFILPLLKSLIDCGHFLLIRFE